MHNDYIFCVTYLKIFKCHLLTERFSIRLSPVTHKVVWSCSSTMRWFKMTINTESRTSVANCNV